MEGAWDCTEISFFFWVVYEENFSEALLTIDESFFSSGTVIVGLKA